MELALKHLSVTVAQDNLVQTVERAQQVQRERPVLRVQQVLMVLLELVVLETEHDTVLVHSESVHVMMRLKLNLSICLPADNSR
jgi:hypothetical protein